VHRSIGKTGEEFSTEIGEQRLNPLILLREALNIAFELLRSYWKKKFMDVMKRNGFESSYVEPCLWKRSDPDGTAADYIKCLRR
jgi:hypothetical protein